MNKQTLIVPPFIISFDKTEEKVSVVEGVTKRLAVVPLDALPSVSAENKN